MFIHTKSIQMYTCVWSPHFHHWYFQFVLYGCGKQIYFPFIINDIADIDLDIQGIIDKHVPNYLFRLPLCDRAFESRKLQNTL